jgi:hypothetical protein
MKCVFCHQDATIIFFLPMMFCQIYMASRSFSFGLFSKWGIPSLYIKEMHTTLFYFIYSTKAGKKPNNDHTTEDSK